MTYILIGFAVAIWLAFKDISKLTKAQKELASQVQSLQQASSTTVTLTEEPQAQSEPTEQELSPEDAVNDTAKDLSDEELDVQFRLSYNAKMVCKRAEVYLEGMNNEQDVDRFNELIERAAAITEEISDDFSRNAALHSIVRLCHQAEWKEDARKYLGLVNDELIKNIIIEEIGDGYS